MRRRRGREAAPAPRLERAAVRVRMERQRSRGRLVDLLVHGGEQRVGDVEQRLDGGDVREGNMCSKGTSGCGWNREAGAPR